MRIAPPAVNHRSVAASFPYFHDTHQPRVSPDSVDVIPSPDLFLLLPPGPKLYTPPVVFRPHHSTMYIDAAYCYRPSSVVCRSVCRSVCHTSEPCKNGCTDPAAVWVENLGGPGEPCIRWRSRSPNGKGKIFGGEWASHCKV